MPPRTWRQQRASGPHGFAVRDPSSPRGFAGPGTLPTKFWRRRKQTPFVLRAVVHSRKPALRTTCRARRCRVHRIPSRVRDDRDPPLLGDEMARADSGDLPDGTSGIFFRVGLDDPNQPGNHCANQSLRAADFSASQNSRDAGCRQSTPGVPHARLAGFIPGNPSPIPLLYDCHQRLLSSRAHRVQELADLELQAVGIAR